MSCEVPILQMSVYPPLTRTGTLILFGEASVADVEATELTKVGLQKIIEKGYTPHHLWNCNNTTLYWKQMPKIEIPDKGRGKGSRI